MKKRYLEIGRVVGTHGLAGDLRVDPWCDTPAFLCSCSALYLQDGTPLQVVRARPHKNIALVKVRGIDTVEQADTMRSAVLYIDRQDAHLDDGVYFVQDIIGCTVSDADTARVYGKVTDVLKTGANDVYQVTDSEGRDYLLPVIDDVVISTDTDKGVIAIRPLKGIFD